MDRIEFIQQLFLKVVEKCSQPSEAHAQFSEYLGVYDSFIGEGQKKIETIKDPNIDVELSEVDNRLLTAICFDHPGKHYIKTLCNILRPARTYKSISEELENVDFLIKKPRKYYGTNGFQKHSGNYEWERLPLLRFFKNIGLRQNSNLLDMAIAKLVRNIK